MKTIIIIGLILVSFNNLQAQHLFPLHVGDRWIYWEYPNYLREVSTLNDTLMNNGKLYFNINSNFYRQEGDSVFSFDSFLNKEYLTFDFSANAGDTITEFQYSENDTLRIILSLKSNGEYFGVKRDSYTFFINHTQLIDDEQSLTITDSLGITHRYSMWYDEYLNGAIINNIQYGNITDIKIPNEVPSSFYLSQNYPNPFNPTTTIKFSISRLAFVSLKVFDLLGREVVSLVNEEMSPGIYSKKFDGSNLTSGIYYYRIQANNFTETKKFILMK